jgi:flagellar export protein FliJ
MSTSTHPDAGMLAVARVRAVRERDSRLGLQQAMDEQRRHETHLVELGSRLDEALRFDGGSVAAFLHVRAGYRALTEQITEVTSELQSARTITESARAHWQRDKTRLSAVELLLERRAEERRAELRRREARELDDIVTQRWRRQNGGDAA